MSSAYDARPVSDGDRSRTRDLVGSGLGIVVGVAALFAFAFLLYNLVSRATIDPDRTETFAREQIKRQTGVDIADLECPEDIRVRRGSRFDCPGRTATGAEITIEARQTSDDGDLAIRVKPGTLPLDATKLEGDLTRRLRDENRIETKSIDCPEGRYQKRGEAFNCTAVDANDQPGSLEVRITSDAGAYEYVIR